MVLVLVGLHGQRTTRGKVRLDAIVLQSASPSLVTLLVAWSLGVPALARQSEGHGIDVADMDLAVSPRVDFYRFANGGWLDRVDIPADRGFVAVRTEINDRAIAQQLDLLHAAAAPGGAAPGSDEAKAAALFAQGLDMAARDRPASRRSRMRSTASPPSTRARPITPTWRAPHSMASA